MPHDDPHLVGKSVEKFCRCFRECCWDPTRHQCLCPDCHCRAAYFREGR